MIYLTIWLYLCGALPMWWWARSRNENAAAKAIAVILWPVIVPMALVA